ncbi:DUF3054 domain-containing protein [Raineyella fluvialis]|uniref:DUF3054 domain-containing protein n=1 Tax=Raineyella fluvialis TaxID=2662261 RepID=UPI001E43E52B|nr:DUF3054 domain-containing protein [Raineyella fluvialis]
MRAAYVLLADLVCVVVFASLGRGAHGEAVGAALVAGTAWPFLVGCLAGWAVLRAWRTPLRPRIGVALMVITVAVGHVLRVVAGGRTHWSFILVSIIALTVLLVGWRLAAQLVRGRRGSLAR